MAKTRKYPFEVPFDEVRSNLDEYIDAVFEALESAFLIMPRGQGFIDYEYFATAYKELTETTAGFSKLEADSIYNITRRHPLILIVIRTILGFTPPEWADVATAGTNEEITQSFARRLDRSIRLDPSREIGAIELERVRIRAMISAACDVLEDGAIAVESDQLHRLDKIDTKLGRASLEAVSNHGVSYSVLLYERLLGRPWATHRDSVSELVGDMLEIEIRDHLQDGDISFYRTTRADRVPGFDQAPDFLAPDQGKPIAIIEAKLTQDDGTARDKVTRVQHLDRIRREREADGRPAFDVIACIGGRGFAVRRSDMEKLILATRGKVFTVSTISRMVEHTRLSQLQGK